MNKAFVLTAGLGNRLKPFTEKVAKPAIEFLTLPMFAYSTYILEQLGVQEFVMNTHHLPETLTPRAQELIGQSKLTFCHEETLLGSAGGIANAKAEFLNKGDFFVINGDSVNLVSDLSLFSTLQTQHQDQNAYATLVLIPHPNAGKGLSAAWIDEQNHIAGFGKAPPKPKSSPFHFTGIIYFSQRALQDMPLRFSNTLLDVITPAIQRGETVLGFTTDQILFGETGNIADYVSFQGQCFKHLYSNDQWGQYLSKVLDYYNPGWRLLDQTQAQSENIVLDDESLLLLNDSSQLIMGPGAQLKGFSAIGKKCSVEVLSSLENVSVLQGANCQLDESLSQSIVI